MATISVGSSGSGQSKPRDCKSLITTIARSFGGENDGRVRSMALDTLNQTLSELSGLRDWNWERTTQSAITLVDGTATYSLDSAYKKPSKAVLIDSDSNEFRSLGYADWERFQDTGKQTRVGNPWVYMLKNAFNLGTVELYPVPDAGAASDYTLELTYFKRLSLCTDSVSSVINAPAEVEPWVTQRATALLAQIKNPEQATLFLGTAARLYNALVRWDTRIRDERLRFSLNVNQNSGLPNAIDWYGRMP